MYTRLFILSSAFIFVPLLPTSAHAMTYGYSKEDPSYYRPAHVLGTNQVTHVCTDYASDGRCIRYTVYDNDYARGPRFYENGIIARHNRPNYARTNDYYYDECGVAHYNPARYRTYTCGGRFRPVRCDAPYASY
jgi:hypothetical protein